MTIMSITYLTFTELGTYSELVLLRQLIHTENGNDILERLVVLENLLDGSRNFVVLSTDLYDNTVRFFFHD